MKKFQYLPKQHKKSLERTTETNRDKKNVARILRKKTEAEAAIQQLILPKLPSSRLEWSLKVRPTIDGVLNIVQYLPMLQQLHEDDWSWIMLLFARQMTKSAYLATNMGHLLTTKPNQRAVFCTFEDEALSVFSNEKWREALWGESELAKQYVDGHTLGSIGYLSTKTNSSARLVTHANNYHHIESKSPNLLVFDEGQNHNLDAWVTAKESQSFTHGKFVIAGIGGWQDTEYESWWLKTDQRKFKYSKSYWRNKLEFRKSGSNRLVWGEYMLDVCDGHWIQQKPENQSHHGYFANQYDAPWIPLKKSDCEEYGLPESESIQYKEETFPQADFIRHVQAGFVAGDVKPFTSQMMAALYDDTISFLTPDQVDYSLGPLVFGADWGGANRTIRWIFQILNKDWPVFRLIAADKLNTSDVDEQFSLCKEWIDDYKISQSVIDAGGGTFQVQQLIKRYAEGCLKYNYLTRPDEPEPDLKELRTYRNNDIQTNALND